MASILRQIIPLLIAVTFVVGVGWVLYEIYRSVTKIQQTASEHMSKKNVVFTKDGLRVGVKDIQNEKYVDATQSYVVKAWNLGTLQKDEELKKRARN